MRGRRRPAAWLLLAAGIWGCASSTAPKGWLPEAEDAATFPYGAWVRLQEQDEDGNKSIVEGELIAVRDGSIVVLVGDRWIEIRKVRVRRIQATYYHAKLWPLSLWSTLGTVSTLSHGLGLIFSAPLWIIVGTAATAGASHEPEEVFPKVPWESLRPYARFPQGMPEGMDLSSGP
jgi:hypothetical protein